MESGTRTDLVNVKINKMSILFNEEAREKLLSGITLISSAVKSTLGPGGRTVIIDSKTHTRGITVTKDGITVAKAVFSHDPVENLAIRIIREASENTSDSAGDGTSTSVVLAEAIVKAGLPHCKGNKTIKITRAIQKYSEKIISELEKSAKKVGKRNLADVATISANGDKSIGKIIADTYKEIGINGAVSIEASATGETYAEISNGVKFDRGYYNQLFVNNQTTNTCQIENALVLITDIEIPTLQQIQHVLEMSARQKRPLLIIAPVTQSVIAILGANFRAGHKFVPIEPPGFGHKQTDLMGDLAIALGGTFYSRNSGDNLEMVEESGLGSAAVVKISKDQTSIEPGQMGLEKLLLFAEHLGGVEKQLESTNKKKEKEFLRQRLSFLNGKVATIFVGGDSEIEQKEKIDRVDDAVCAVRSALEEGIIPGGGIALMNSTSILYPDETTTLEEDIAIQILISALCSPFDMICENAEVTIDNNFFCEDRNPETGIDATNGQIVNMYEAGIIDPLKVTKNALRNAVSVAITIMSTSTTITN